MQMNDDDLHAYAARSRSIAARRGQKLTELPIPANVTLSDTQRSWLKRNLNGAKLVQNGKEVEL